MVYAIEIGQKEVKVDAGNGQVLYTDDMNNEDKEGSRPSSIQVPDKNENDREGNNRRER